MEREGGALESRRAWSWVALDEALVYAALDSETISVACAPYPSPLDRGVGASTLAALAVVLTELSLVQTGATGPSPADKAPEDAVYAPHGPSLAC